MAEKTLLEIVQHTLRVNLYQLMRCFCTFQVHTGHLMFPTGIWSETLFFEVKLKCINGCAQMFYAPLWFVELFPVNTKGKAG